MNLIFVRGEFRCVLAGSFGEVKRMCSLGLLRFHHFDNIPSKTSTDPKSVQFRVLPIERFQIIFLVEFIRTDVKERKPEFSLVRILQLV